MNTSNKHSGGPVRNVFSVNTMAASGRVNMYKEGEKSRILTLTLTLTIRNIYEQLLLTTDTLNSHASNVLFPPSSHDNNSNRIFILEITSYLHHYHKITFTQAGERFFLRLFCSFMMV